MFCAYCGAKMQEGARFCNSCGKPVKTVAADEKEITVSETHSAAAYTPPKPVSAASKPITPVVDMPSNKSVGNNVVIHSYNDEGTASLKIKVFRDGKPVGELKKGETVTVPNDTDAVFLFQCAFRKAQRTVKAGGGELRIAWNRGTGKLHVFDLNDPNSVQEQETLKSKNKKWLLLPAACFALYIVFRLISMLISGSGADAKETANKPSATNNVVSEGTATERPTRVPSEQPSQGTDAQTSQAREVLFNGTPVSWFFETTIQDVISTLSLSPLAADAGAKYNGDDMDMWYDTDTGKISSIISFSPYLFTIDGTTLQKNRAELAELLGEPSEVSGTEGSFYVVYDIESYRLSFELGDQSAAAWRITASGKSDGADKSVSGATSAQAGEVLCNGKPIVKWLGAKTSDLQGAFGQPTFGTPVDGSLHNGGEFWGYDNVLFILDYQTGSIGYVEMNPEACTIDGASLDKNRAGLIEILGNAKDEGWSDGEVDASYYYMEYQLAECNLTIALPSMDKTASSVLVQMPQTQSAEILYKGKSIMNMMGSALADLRKEFGEPESEGIVGEGGMYGYSYGDITFAKSDYGVDIDRIFGESSALSINGTALDVSREELVSLLGAPAYEDNLTDYTGEETIGRYARYYIEWFYIDFEIPDTVGKVNAFSIGVAAD